MCTGMGIRRSGSAVCLGMAMVVGLCALGGATLALALPEIVEVDSLVGTIGTPANSGIPPDTMGAIGQKGQFVELLNSGYSQYDMNAGTLIGARMTLEDFWDNAFLNTYNNPPPPTGGPPPPPPSLHTASDPFDPRILYDDNTQRWYAISIDDPRSITSRIYVGVTTSSDPSPENWRGFVIDADADGAQWADFPTLGYSSTGLFIGAGMRPVFESDPTGQVHLHGIPLTSLTGATPSIAGLRTIENITTNVFSTFQPAVDVEGISAQPSIAYRGFFPDAGTIKYMEIPDDFFSGGSLGPATDFGLTGISSPTNVSYGSSQDLTPIEAAPRLGSNVVLSPLGYWGALNITAIDSIGVSSNAIRVFQLNTVTSDLLSDELIRDTVMDFIYPSIAVSPFGEVVVGFNWTWNVDDPAMPFTSWGAPSPMAAAGGWDGNGNFGFGIPLILDNHSTAAYERLSTSGRNRWGDYSATTIAPNGHDFFTIQEFANAPMDWATSISQLNVTGVDVPEFSGAGLPAGFHMALAQPLEGGLSLQRLRLSGEFGAGNLPDELIVVGDMATETYRLRFDAVLDTGARLPRVLTDLEALVTQKYTLSEIDGDLRLFDTELLMFEATLPGMFLTLDDLLPSLGQLLMVETAEGTIVKSYIDLMPMLLIDGDADGSFEHTFRSLAPGRLLLRAAPVPEPATVALCLLALAALRLRRAPRARRQ